MALYHSSNKQFSLLTSWQLSEGRGSESHWRYNRMFNSVNSENCICQNGLLVVNWAQTHN